MHALTTTHISRPFIDTAAFVTLVSETLPSLHAHFVELDVPIEILASQWWLCLYANVLPTATLLRTWDVVLAGGGVDTLVASALALLRRVEGRLKETEVSDHPPHRPPPCMKVLTTAPSIPSHSAHQPTLHEVLTTALLPSLCPSSPTLHASAHHGTSPPLPRTSRACTRSSQRRRRRCGIPTS